MVKKWGLTLFLVFLLMSGVALAAEAEAAGGASPSEAFIWLVVTAGAALMVAASFGAVSQSRAIISACEGISRNPGSADAIRGLLILGLAFIESLVIYVLLIDFILLFLTIGRIS